MTMTSQQLYRKRCLERHQCVRCKAPANGDVQTCEACRERLNADERDRRLARRQAGLCERCGGLPRPGKTTCEACRQRDLERTRANRLKKLKRRNP